MGDGETLHMGRSSEHVSSRPTSPIGPNPSNSNSSTPRKPSSPNPCRPTSPEKQNRMRRTYNHK